MGERAGRFGREVVEIQPGAGVGNDDFGMVREVELESAIAVAPYYNVSDTLEESDEVVGRVRLVSPSGRENFVVFLGFFDFTLLEFLTHVLSKLVPHDQFSALLKVIHGSPWMHFLGSAIGPYAELELCRWDEYPFEAFFGRKL